MKFIPCLEISSMRLYLSYIMFQCNSFISAFILSVVPFNFYLDMLKCEKIIVVATYHDVKNLFCVC